MLNMDYRGEATSWVGDLFRKLESLCCDMDGVVRQEIGHVEHQFQNLGAKVAKMCSNMDEEVSEFLDEEKESDIDIVDSGASNIGIDGDHYKKDSCSVQPSEKVEIEWWSVGQNIDSRTDENSGVTDEASKEEKLASEGNLYDKWESDDWDNYMEAETLLEEYFALGDFENDMMDFTTSDDHLMDLSEKEIEMMEALLSIQKSYWDDIDEAILDDILFADISAERMLKPFIQSKACRQLSKEADHEPKQAGHEFPEEMVQKSEESETNPEFNCVEVIQKLEELNTDQDSDWVIV